MSNLRVCCLSCNHIKGNMDVNEFVQLLVLVNGFPSEVRNDLFKRLKIGGKAMNR